MSQKFFMKDTNASWFHNDSEFVVDGIPYVKCQLKKPLQRNALRQHLLQLKDQCVFHEGVLYYFDFCARHFDHYLTHECTRDGFIRRLPVATETPKRPYPISGGENEKTIYLDAKCRLEKSETAKETVSSNESIYIPRKKHDAENVIHSTDNSVSNPKQKPVPTDVIVRTETDNSVTSISKADSTVVDTKLPSSPKSNISSQQSNKRKAHTELEGSKSLWPKTGNAESDLVSQWQTSSKDWNSIITQDKSGWDNPRPSAYKIDRKKIYLKDSNQKAEKSTINQMKPYSPPSQTNRYFDSYENTCSQNRRSHYSTTTSDQYAATTHNRHIPTSLYRRHNFTEPYGNGKPNQYPNNRTDAQNYVSERKPYESNHLVSRQHSGKYSSHTKSTRAKDNSYFSYRNEREMSKNSHRDLSQSSHENYYRNDGDAQHNVDVRNEKVTITRFRVVGHDPKHDGREIQEFI